MKTTILFISLLVCLCGITKPTIDPPQIELANGQVKLALYLPDTSQGYYQGTRFDWSGAFKSLDYKGHRYVDQWFENYNPKTHDAINGPAEEFMPIDFKEAKPGETFVKIGVGVLRKPDEQAYTFSKHYDIANHGKWTVKTHKDHVGFTHELTDATGYAYRYTKTVRLSKNKPELILEHSLKNMGQKIIETSVYNHNFWVIDKQPTGPQIAVRFPFEVKGEGKGFGTVIQPTGKNLLYARELEKKEQVYSAGLQGFGPTASDYNIRIENLKTGAGVRATGDQPLEKLVFWACATTSCPEPYLHLKAAPGQEVRWKITYDFYEKPTP
ncbi:hypothetical protein [Spirosoma areae]